MNTRIANELMNLFNKDKVIMSERIKINALCNDLCTNVEVSQELNICLYQIINVDNFNLLERLPKIIFGVLQLLSKVEYYKEIKPKSGRLKYLIYCLVITHLFNHHIELLETIEIEKIRDDYEDVYNLVVLKPKKIAKNTCIGNLFNKLFSIVKIIV